MRANGRVWRRLDRCLVNFKFVDRFASIQINVLEKTPSDHSPLLIQCTKNLPSGPKSFKFQNIWLSHPNFMDTVNKSWHAKSFGGGMHGLFCNLKNLKQDLQEWNKNVFGNLFDDIKLFEKKVQQAEMDFEADPSEINREQWFHFKALLKSKYKLERIFWKQKSHIQWLKEGDSNSHFFPSFARVRHKKQQITSIYNQDGHLVSSLPEIGEAAVDYFSSLYSVEPQIHPEDILHFIPTIVDNEDNQRLMQMHMEDEIKDAVWDLNQNGASGPDGFNGKFYKK
ncbi:unnamed protein product [Cuscuta europaea]|uniref:Uncharacterized protein n=1 Tax=Cuscuta europaea TaxID=41803 RepID=A0A9P0Z466_CUSEU|nr:unnamed protein product [Cuscuta europaea]